MLILLRYQSGFVRRGFRLTVPRVGRECIRLGLKHLGGLGVQVPLEEFFRLPIASYQDRRLLACHISITAGYGNKAFAPVKYQ